jgi:hypothetical protein
MRAIGEAYIDFHDVLEARGQEDVSLALLAFNVEGSSSRPFLRCFEICAGDTVSVHGITVKTHLNGKLGVVKEVKEGGMLVVTMQEGGAGEMFHSSNLKKELGTTKGTLWFPETMATVKADSSVLMLSLRLFYLEPGARRYYTNLN